VGKKWGVLLAVSLATLMLLIDFMAVSVALPAIRQSLGASLPQLQWVIEAFVVALAAFVLTAGYIADLRGRRPVFLTGVAVFSLGSLLAYYAPSVLALIGARIVQGFGGAMVFATGSVLLTDAFRGGRARVALATWGTVTGLSVVFSPLIGGAVSTYLGWRWLFLIEVPIGALALVAGTIAIKEPRPVAGSSSATSAGASAVRGKHLVATQQRSDWRGLGLFTGAIAILVIGLVRTTQTAWSQSGVLECFTCTALLLVAFVAVEIVEPYPMLQIALFRDRSFTGSSLAAFGLSWALMGPFMFLVLYLYQDLGYSVLAIGVRLLLLTALTLPFLPLTGWLDRHVPLRLLICSGLALVATGFWLMSRLSATSTWTALAPGLVVAGVGLELVNPRLASAAAAVVRPQLAAVASRTSTTFRQVGTATGVAVLGSVFATRLSDGIATGLSGIPGLAAQVPRITSLVTGGRSARAVTSAPPVDQPTVMLVVQKSFADAMHEVLLVAALVALASAVLALLIKSPRRAAAPVALPKRALTASVAAPSTTTTAALPSTQLRAPSPPKTSPAATTPAAASRSAEQPVLVTSTNNAEPPAAHPNGSTITADRVITDPAVIAGAARSAGRNDNDSVSAPWQTLAELLTARTERREARATPSRATQEVAEASSAEPAEVVEGEPFEAVTEQPAEVVAEQPAEVVAEQPAEVVAEQPAEVVAEEPTEVVAEEPTEEVLEEPAEVVLDLTPPSNFVRGQITGATGEPVPGATVTLVDSVGQEAGCVVAGKDGCFALVDLREGNYTLVAAAPTYRPSVNPVALQDGRADAAVTLVGIGSLVARVTRAKDGSALVAEIELRGPKDNPAMIASTDNDGNFTVTDLVEGNYTMLVRSAGYQDRKVPVTIRRAATEQTEVAMVGLGHLYGAVSGPGGGWLPGALVNLTDSSGRLISSAETDGAGSYHFAQLLEGSYNIVVVLPDGTAATEVNIEPGTAVLADVTLGEP
jgi:MFS family permease